jgi:hypothetical protein
VTIGLLLRFISTHFALVAYFATGVGSCLFLAGVWLFARKRSLASVSTSTVGTASAGRIAISGKATGPYTLLAPISGKRCYLSRATVWQQSQSNSSGKWNKVAQETLHLPFFIEDSTGQLLVDPSGASLDDLQPNLSQEFGIPSSSLKSEDIPPNVSAFLVRHGVPVNVPTRIEERSLQPEAPILITGAVVKNPGIEVRPLAPGTDDPLHRPVIDRGSTGTMPLPEVRPEIIKLASGTAPSSTAQMTQQAKIAAALNRAGVTGPEGWTVARVRFDSGGEDDLRFGNVISRNGQEQDAASKGGTKSPPISPSETDSTNTDKARISASNPGNDENGNSGQPETANAFDLTPPLVLMKSSASARFVISSFSPAGITSSLGWSSVLMVLSGTALTLLGLCMMLFEQQVRSSIRGL